MQHWIEEYKVDGYRFDLSKGFTQTNTLGNTSAWGQYDASRVAIWKMYANYIWSMDSDFYVILEHFAENSEEKELAEYGMMLWGNMNHSYSQLSMGYDDSFDWGSYKTRGWSVPHLVSYMESHDEERMMYRNTTSGNSSASYDIQNLDTGLERIILSAAMFFTVPGPKMLWQFGELGYDTSIDFNGRTGEKPIKWYYYDIDERKDIYDHFAALIKLKTENEAFRSDDFEIVDNGLLKRIKITDATMNVIVLGNFDVEQGSVSGDFHDTGWWYDYFKGDSLEVNDTAVSLTLEPGEFRIYTSVKLDKPELSVSVNDLFYGRDYDSWFNVYPNPVTDRLNIDLADEYAGQDLSVAILDINGRQVYSSSSFSDSYIDAGSLPRGIYFMRLSTPVATATRKFVKK